MCFDAKKILTFAVLTSFVEEELGVLGTRFGACASDLKINTARSCIAERMLVELKPVSLVDFSAEQEPEGASNSNPSKQ